MKLTEITEHMECYGELCINCPYEPCQDWRFHNNEEEEEEEEEGEDEDEEILPYWD